MTSTTARRRTTAAHRLPWPRHSWCAAALPIHLTAGALVVLDGDCDGLLERLASVNDDREVLRPTPLVLRRVGALAAQSVRVVQPALSAGTPVIIAGGAPEEIVAAGEPAPDLFADVRRIDKAIEPVVSGTIRGGFTVTLAGPHSAEHFMQFIQALIQSSLAGIPVRP